MTLITVNGTTLYTERRGEGPPLLLIHGGGEDAAMLARQADGLAAAGYDVVTYDRRGTRRSGRQDWPGGGADQHADDAAALIRELGWRLPTVVGVSSGGVIALTLAGRHPDSVGSIVAWEPPAVGIIEGGMRGDRGDHGAGRCPSRVPPWRFRRRAGAPPLDGARLPGQRR